MSSDDPGLALADALSAARLLLGRLTSFELARGNATPEQAHRLELLVDLREAISHIRRCAGELCAAQAMELESCARQRLAEGTRPIELASCSDEPFDDQVTAEQPPLAAADRDTIVVGYD